MESTLISANHSDSALCPYCKCALDQRPATCALCLTAHHENCWIQHGRCSVFGCSGHAARETTKKLKPRRWIARAALCCALAAYICLAALSYWNEDMAFPVFIILSVIAFVLAFVAFHKHNRMPALYDGEFAYVVAMCVLFPVSYVGLPAIMIFYAIRSYARRLIRLV